MGTNYYLHKPLTNVCSHCGRSDPPQKVHLGKSSVGWCFSLCVDPDDVNRKDWESICFWLATELINGSVIYNEYGEEIKASAFIEIVTKRAHDSKRGPNGLSRHQVDGVHCIGHGEGTYDYIAGEFS